jgi:hypothetical protein
MLRSSALRLPCTSRQMCRGELQGQILTGCVASCRYDNLYGDYYISPQFLEAITVSG